MDSAVSELSRLQIDGSVLEGGGQLLRNTVSLSALLGRPIFIDNIRRGRDSPGLKAQHATGLRLVADICGGRLVGCERGSSQIEFSPGPIDLSRNYVADTQTAGSTALLLQISLPCLLFSSSAKAPARVTCKGGTNALHAPQIDYTDNVFLPFLSRRFGLHLELHIQKRGYHPKGGGAVNCVVHPIPGPLPSLVLTERGDVTRISGRSYVAGLPVHLAHSMCDAATAFLIKSGIDPALIDIAAIREKPSDAVASGSGIVLWAETLEGCVLGGSAIGSKGMDSVKIGEAAAEELIRNLAHGGCVDEYLQDQMIMFLALARGRSVVKTGPLTLHTKTAIWIAEQLSGAHFEVEEAEDRYLIQCDGIGYAVTF